MRLSEIKGLESQELAEKIKTEVDTYSKLRFPPELIHESGPKEVAPSANAEQSKEMIHRMVDELIARATNNG